MSIRANRRRREKQAKENSTRRNDRVEKRFVQIELKQKKIEIEIEENMVSN